MVSYLGKRTAQAVVTIYSVITITFVLIRLLPGGPVTALRAQLVRNQGTSMTMAQINQRIATQLNVDTTKPMWEQYVEYMASVLQGDFGVSIWYNVPTFEILGPAIPWTVFLMATSLFLTFALGIVLGAFMAYREGTRFDGTSTAIALLCNSTPYYVIALLGITYLGYGTSGFPEIFPTGGRYASGLDPSLMDLAFIRSALWHGTLPILSLTIAGFGGWALTMRGNSIRILGENYLRVARLRGLSERRIALRYVGRNAVLPMYTGLLIAIGGTFGGAIILEQIFSYHGVGYYLINAIGHSDYPVMMGAFILITVATTLGVFFADLSYGWIDPRAERGESRESY
jgi:peptide/nickel transport system permease protein